MSKNICLLAVAACVFSTPVFADTDAALVERGAYLGEIMDCAGCHMPRDGDGVPMVEAGLSGGNVGFEIPGLGIFWPPNLTASDTGLGSWSDEQILAAIQTGERPDGRTLVPVMPWPSYAVLEDGDARALVAWLRTLPAADSTAPGAPVGSAADATAPFYRVTLPTR